MIRVVRWPFAPGRRRGVDLVEVQGNVLRPYGHPVAAHVFVRFTSATGGRSVLRIVLGSITHSDTWAEKPDSTLNVAFTAPELTALGMPARLLRSFPDAFRQGMAARAALLGDTGASSPDLWDDGFGSGEIHAVFSIYASGDGTLDAAVSRLETLVTVHGVEVVSVQVAHRLPELREHFGYVDGMGQPALEGTGSPTFGAGDLGAFHQWNGLPIGEIFHGHVDADGDISPGPAGLFGLDGTFLVWRKLHEDAAGFRRWTTEQAARLHLDEELLKAKLVGRWPDGTPLALSPDRPDPEIAGDPERVNAFDFSDDPDGLRCPLGAHIRRVNPRTSLGFGDALSARQRIVRRGMSYGPPLAPEATVDDGADRGIFFLAYMADIERQFEFIQANWCNDGDAVNVGHDRDPFIGRRDGDAKFTIPGAEPKFVHPLPELVTTRGGEYLWVPSLRSLRALGEGTFLRPPSSFHHSGPTTIREAVDLALGTALGVALAPIAGLIAYVRGERVVHWVGVSHRATFEVVEPDDEAFDGTMLDRAGRYEAVARLSRGFGRPFARRDVHGLAVRVLEAGGPGRPQDFLLASARPGSNGHEATTTSLAYEPRLTSTLRLTVPTGKLILIARPIKAMPPDEVVHDGGASGLSFDLFAQFLGGTERRVGRVHLDAELPAAETDALHFAPRRDAGGVRATGVLNAARGPVYRASAWARERRRGRQSARRDGDA